MATTLRDIADKTGLSIPTVSQVLGSQSHKYPLETRTRVHEAARLLGYRSNGLARAMVTGKSKILGVITSYAEGEHVMRILTGALEATNQDNFLLKILHLSKDTVDEATIARCVEWRLAGVIVIGMENTPINDLYSKLKQQGTEVVVVDNLPAPGNIVPHIASEDDQGMRAAVNHLRDQGHRHIALMGATHGKITAYREAAFRSAMTEVALPIKDEWICKSHWLSIPQIEREAYALLTGEELPTAVVATADTIAVIVMRTARTLGIRIPGDLSVTGYSNSMMSEFSEPPLTTVRQPFREMGRAAAEYLMHRADGTGGADTEPQVRYLPTNLITRESTAPPRLATGPAKRTHRGAQ